MNSVKTRAETSARSDPAMLQFLTNSSLRIFYALMETPPHSDSLELNGLQWFQRVNGEHLLKCQRTALSKECNLLSIESVEKIQNSKSKTVL